MESIEWINLLAMVLVAGWFSAFVVQAIKRPAWPSWVKLLLSALVAFGVALASSWLNGDLWKLVELWKQDALMANEIIAFFTLIFTSAATWYRFYFKDAGWAETLGKWPGSGEG